MIDLTDRKLWLAVAQASAAAYELDPVKRQAALPPGAAEIKHFDGIEDARAIYVAWNGLKLFANQGTQFSRGEIPSIFANLKVDGADLGAKGIVHAGYWQQAQALRAAAEWSVGQGVDLIGGHSMGGSITELLCGVFFPTIPGISFGAPKVGDAAFWQATAFRPVRIVHERDMAPIWPPRFIGNEYEQPPENEQWLHNGSVEAVPHRTCAPDSIDDHNIDNYIAALQAL